MSAIDLLDSARHKLRSARYHAEALQGILEQRPPDDPEHPLRAPLEGHLEGLAASGTAAAEKTIRSADPEQIGSRASIPQMIMEARRGPRPPDVVEFVASFEEWWTGRTRDTRYAEFARDLRNSAAHGSYEKTPQGPRWLVKLGQARPVVLEDFVVGYLPELDELEELIDRAETIARNAAGVESPS